MELFSIVTGLASVAGLVFSILAFVQAKRASVAAAEARDAVAQRVVADELELACVRAEQLADFVEHDRLDEAALRIAELTAVLSELPRRRTPYLADHVNDLMNSREQVTSIGTALASARRKNRPIDRDHVAAVARKSSMTLREILGAQIQARHRGSVMTETREPDAGPLVERLLAKSKAGKLKWEATADRQAFVASIGGETTFRIRLLDETGENDWGQPETVSTPRLDILDDKGRLLWDVGPSKAKGLWDLYEVARRIGNRVDERLNAAISELDKL